MNHVNAEIAFLSTNKSVLIQVHLFDSAKLLLPRCCHSAELDSEELVFFPLKAIVSHVARIL